MNKICLVKLLKFVSKLKARIGRSRVGFCHWVSFWFIYLGIFLVRQQRVVKIIIKKLMIWLCKIVCPVNFYLFVLVYWILFHDGEAFLFISPLILYVGWFLFGFVLCWCEFFYLEVILYINGGRTQD